MIITGTSARSYDAYIDTRVYANLVHDSDARILTLLVELHHGGRDVTCGDDMLLLSDGTLDDGSVESVRD